MDEATGIRKPDAPTSQKGETLGYFLRRRRDELGFSIETLALQTRISIHYLHAIEEDRLDRLPSLVSAKGFIRTYLRFLGLDEKVWLAKYADLLEQTQLPPQLIVERLKQKKSPPAYILAKQVDLIPMSVWVSIILAGVVLLLLFLAIFMPKGKGPVSKESVLPIPNVISPESDAKPIENKDAPRDHEEVSSELVQEKEIAKLTAPLPFLSSEPLATGVSEDAGGPMPFTLTIKAIEPTWVQVKIDGTEKKEVLLRVGEEILWRARTKFLLTMGNAGGVRIRLNGQELGPFGPMGSVVRDVSLP